MNEVQGVTQIAEGISNFGVMVVICSAFIVLSLLMWVALFNWFKSFFDCSMTNNA